MFRIKGGTDQIIKLLCSSFDHEKKIKLGNIVESIKVNKDCINVEVNNENGEAKVRKIIKTLNLINHEIFFCSQ